MSETPASARGDSSAPAAQPKAQAGAKKRVRSRRALPLPLYYLATLLAGLGIWWIVAELFISKLLPTPADIAVTAVHLSANGTLGNDILASLRRVLIGFVIGSAVAIPFGFVMGWYRWARGFLEPWIQFFRAVPPLALIPFVVLALGIGEESKILIIALASFLATVVATAQGVTDVDRTLINAARVLGANDFTIFYHVLVPAALPYILVGMRIGLANSWATVVAAELIAASSGLGYLTQEAALYFRIEVIFVAVICIGILGLLMDRGILLAQTRLTSWQERR